MTDHLEVSVIAQIAEHIHDLTRPHLHVEAYSYDLDPLTRVDRQHRATVPALLAQLGADTRDTSVDSGDGARGTYSSKPPSRLDALDTVARIDLGAARWIRDLTGEWSDPDADTASVVRRVGALAASCTPAQQRAVARDVRGWYVAARVVTGWDSPAWAPDATCPVCEERGTLRIRLHERVGMCTDPECRAWWDASTIGLLADHVRAETMADVVHGRAPRCQVLGDYEPHDLEFICRACGSARCVRAVGDRLRAVADEGRQESSLRRWKAWAVS